MNLTKEELFKEIIIAGSIGDAYGYNVEFTKWNYIKKIYGDKELNLKLVKVGLQKKH